MDDNKGCSSHACTPSSVWITTEPSKSITVAVRSHSRVASLRLWCRGLCTRDGPAPMLRARRAAAAHPRGRRPYHQPRRLSDIRNTQYWHRLCSSSRTTTSHSSTLSRRSASSLRCPADSPKRQLQDTLEINLIYFCTQASGMLKPFATVLTHTRSKTTPRSTSSAPTGRSECNTPQDLLAEVPRHARDQRLCLRDPRRLP